MSKELEMLKRIKELKYDKCFYPLSETELNTISNALIDNETLKTINKCQLKTIDLYIEKNHKLLKYRQAIEIIKEKGIIVQFIKETDTVEQYNAGVFGTLINSLTKEEYDLLKEVLK